MKILITIHNSMFDAAFPLIKRLKEVCDLHCILEFDMSEENILGIKEKDFAEKFFVQAYELLKDSKFSNFLPLNNTTLIKYYPPKDVLGHVKTQLYECIVLSKIDADFIYYYNTPIQSSLFVLFSRTPWGTAVHDPIPHSDEKHVLIRSIISWPIRLKCRHYFLFSKNLIDPFVKSRRISKECVYLTRLGAYETLNPKLEISKTNNERLSLLFFGKIKKYKGLRYLLEAISLLPLDIRKSIDFVIAGSGEIENNIINFEEYQNIQVVNRYISNDELANFIRNCDVVICPYTDATQSGVVMSSYAYCKPVIVTNVGGLVEMVEDDVTGKIIPPCDSLAICNEIIFLHNHKEIIEKMGNNIYDQYFKGQYSWDKIADSLLENITNICKNE